MSEHLVRSPLPGIFYRRPAPDQPPFVEEGDAVTADSDHRAGRGHEAVRRGQGRRRRQPHELRRRRPGRAGRRGHRRHRGRGLTLCRSCWSPTAERSPCECCVLLATWGCARWRSAVRPTWTLCTCRWPTSRSCIGPAPAGRSYLDEEAVIEAAHSSGADAVHPGYGFLSERASFAQKVGDAGLTFVGPAPEAIRMMGDKVARPRDRGAGRRAHRSRLRRPGLRRRRRAGGRGRASGATRSRSRPRPAAVAAASGSCTRPTSCAKRCRGYRGRRSRRSATPRSTWSGSSAPHGTSRCRCFGDGDHFVHLGERECSLQRRRQKVVEEARAPGFPEEIRSRMTASAVALAAEVGYHGAGTVEYLYDAAAPGVLLHRDEHPHPGGAPDHRVSDPTATWCVSSSPSPRASRCRSPGRRALARTRDRVPAQRGEPRP